MSVEPESDSGAFEQAHGSAQNPPKEATKRQTRSYATEAAAMRSAISMAVLLLANVKCEKGSQDTMNAVIGLLKGSV